MRIEIKMGYDVIVADVSGGELEMLTKFIAKAHICTREHAGNQYMNVIKADRLDWEISIPTNGLQPVSLDVFRAIRENDKKKDRAALVEAIVNGDQDSSMKSVDDLITQLYYQDVVNKKQKESMAYKDRNAQGVSFDINNGEWLTVTIAGDVRQGV